MSRSLHIGDGLTLPVDAVTQTFVIFGKRGSGKSNTAVVLAEEMHRAGAPFVVLDPISAWWGLKSSFDGSGEGLGVYVFGGPHADLPLQPTAGELMAQVFIAHRIPMVLDMKGWTGADRARFVTAFAEYLLGHNDRVPAHVFLEEADAFIPQRPYKGEEKMLGAMDRLVRWGRQEGLGATAITQRSAKINKDVTTQAETLIAHRTTGPQDRAAIDDWIKYHAGDEKRTEILSSLPTLPAGTAWVWSPEWLGLLRKVSVRRRETYDSAGTPKLGEKRVEPKALAQVDVDRLRDKMEATIEQAKATDPKELTKRIRDLERQLASQPTEAEVRVEKIEVPVLNGEVDRLMAAAELLSETSTRLLDVGEQIRGASSEIVAAIGRVQNPAPGRTRRASQAVAERPRHIPRSTTPNPAQAVTARPPGEVRLGKAERSILSVLAQHPQGRSKRQVALATGYAINGGGFNNAIGALRSAGYAEGSKDLLVATDAGVDAIADQVEPLPSGRALLDHWLAHPRLGKAERLILEYLHGIYPDTATKEEVAEATGYAAEGGGFNNAVGRLRTLELIAGGRDALVASEDLF